MSKLPGLLTNTTWRLVEFQSMDDATGTLRPNDPALYTMILNADGTVFMRLYCNRATGTWTGSPGSDQNSGIFTFGPLAMTRALCTPPSMDEQIARQSSFIRSYLLKDRRLFLSLMADGGIYEWEPVGSQASTAVIYASPEDGGPRNWEVSTMSTKLNLRAEPSLSARVIVKYAAGTILDNLGCEKNEKMTWCDVQQLGGGPRGFVSANYLKPAVSPNGAPITGPDDSALRAGQGDFDASGSLPCSRYSGQPTGQCNFSVARAGGGYAAVVVTHQDGFTRMIYFRLGRPIGADTSQADGYPEFRAAQEKDLHLIYVGEEQYEIPEAVIFGG